MIHILHTIRQGQIGGGESHVLDLVKFLDRKRFKSTVLSFTSGMMVDNLNELGVECYVIPTTTPFDIRIWKRVKILIQNLNINIVHAHGTRAMSNSYWASIASNVPIIYTVHGWSFHDDQSMLIRKIRASSEKFLVSKAQGIISVSRSNQQTGEKEFGSFKSEIIPNGIDTNHFSSLEKENSIRLEFGINASTIVIGFIARMTKQKDPIILLKVFSKLMNSHDNLVLLMVGDGDMQKQVETFIDDNGLMQNVRLLGFRDDIREIIGSLDLYCLPSLWEGMPLGLLEAMSMGKAVVTTNVDGTREVVNHNINGLLFQPGDVNSLYECLNQLIEDGVQRKKLGKFAQKTIKENHGVNRMILETQKVYLNMKHDQ